LIVAAREREMKREVRERFLFSFIRKKKTEKGFY